MNDTLFGFVKKHHPNVLKEYYRHEGKDNIPKVGTIVKTLTSGYGGSGGDIRVVSGYDSLYIYLEDVNKSNKARYACKIDEWWKDLEIID